MNDYIALLLSSIAGFSTLLGNIILFIKVKDKYKLLSFALGLSFIVMFLISIFDLIPHSLSLIINKYSKIYIFTSSLIYILIGYSIVKILGNKVDNQNKLYKIGILSTITLLIHNIPEGIITSISTYTDFHLGLKMAFLIMLHNIPEGICIALPIYYSTKNKTKAFVYTLISGLGEVCGSLITIILLKQFINDYILSIILMITSGIMITLSIKEILKEAISYKRSLYLISGIIVGIIIIFIAS